MEPRWTIVRDHQERLRDDAAAERLARVARFVRSRRPGSGDIRPAARTRPRPASLPARIDEPFRAC
jgi:hypothetical protein